MTSAWTLNLLDPGLRGGGEVVGLDLLAELGVFALGKMAEVRLRPSAADWPELEGDAQPARGSIIPAASRGAAEPGYGRPTADT